MIKENHNKIMKRVIKQRDREFVPPYDPTTTYKRTFDRTKMSWPLALLWKGRYDILVFVSIVIILLMIALGLFVYYIIIPALKYILEVLF